MHVRSHAAIKGAGLLPEGAWKDFPAYPVSFQQSRGPFTIGRDTDVASLMAWVSVRQPGWNTSWTQASALMSS